MFVIIKKGEIVKSKSSKTNQGPHLVLIYYKLIFMVSDGRENFQTEELFQTEEKMFRRKQQKKAIV